MSKCYLELKEVPKSCMDCDIEVQMSSENDFWCNAVEDYVDEYIVTRHPDCPLKIEEDTELYSRGYKDGFKAGEKYAYIGD